MGRLQRKKKVVKKKRSDVENGVAEAKSTSENDAPEGESKPSPSGVQRKRPSIPQKKPVSAPKDNFITKSIQFLREVKAELKKVTWPSRKQAAGSTLVVILLVMIISLFLGVVDMGLSSLIRLVLP